MESIPERIGAYRVLRRLIAPGPAETFLGRFEGPRGFARDCVLKRMKSTIEGNERLAEELTREAAICARINHPAILRLIDFFEDDGQLVLALEYVDGTSLEQLLDHLAERRQKLGDAAVFYIGHRIAGALAHAHAATDEQGAPTPIIHRNLHPSNVVIGTDGDVRLTGFGVGKILGRTPDTAMGTIKGTPGYMAPEQARGEAVTVKADTYGMGLLLWSLLTGRKPPSDGTWPAKIGTLRHDLPREIAAVIDASLDRFPGTRRITCSEIERWLGKVVSGDKGRRELKEQMLSLPSTAASDPALALPQDAPVSSDAPARAPVNPFQGVRFGPPAPVAATSAPAANDDAPIAAAPSPEVQASRAPAADVKNAPAPRSVAKVASGRKPDAGIAPALKAEVRIPAAPGSDATRAPALKAEVRIPPAPGSDATRAPAARGVKIPPAPKLEVTSTPIPGAATGTPVPGGATVSVSPGAATITPMTSVATSSPVRGVATASPLPGVATITPLPGGATASPLPRSATSSPLPGVATASPLPGVATITPLPGVTTITPLPGLTSSAAAPLAGAQDWRRSLPDVENLDEMIDSVRSPDQARLSDPALVRTRPFPPAPRLPAGAATPFSPAVVPSSAPFFGASRESAHGASPPSAAAPFASTGVSMGSPIEAYEVAPTPPPVEAVVGATAPEFVAPPGPPIAALPSTPTPTAAGTRTAPLFGGPPSPMIEARPPTPTPPDTASHGAPVFGAPPVFSPGPPPVAPDPPSSPSHLQSVAAPPRARAPSPSLLAASRRTLGTGGTIAVSALTATVVVVLGFVLRARSPEPYDRATASATAGAAIPTIEALAASTSSAAADAGATPASDLPAGFGYLTVVTSASAQVYVSGKRLGPTNEALQLRCGRWFVRLASPREGRYPEWVSHGETVDVACQTTTRIEIAPAPEVPRASPKPKKKPR